jgi:hypothetical protein
VAASCSTWAARRKEAREKLVAEVKERLEELLPEAFEVLAEQITDREFRKRHPKIAQDSALAIVAYILGKPGQELTVKGDQEPKVIFWNHPAVHYASELKAKLEQRNGAELDSGDA